MAALSFAWYASAALARVRWWLVPVIGFASGALLIPANPFWVLVGITPVAALLALGVSRVATKDWAVPLYVVALLGGVMSGYTGSVQGHSLTTTWVLLAFALLAYIIGVVEDMPLALWIAPVFAVWSVYDSAALLGDLYRPPLIALLCAGIGTAIGFLRFTSLSFFGSLSREKLLSYALPFYTAALMAAVLTGVYGSLVGINRPFYGAIPDALLVYALVAFGVMVLERRPEALVIPVGFATWAIAQFSLGLVPLMIAYSLLGIGIFVAQFVWYVVPSASSRLPATRLHRILSLGGQMLVVLAIIEQGGLSVNGGQLVHVGAASLFVLALLIFWYGHLRKSTVVRRYCEYGGGLLLALVVSWELVAFGQTRLELLLLAPASYLVVVAPFLMQNKELPGHQQIGQMVSILGAGLLLLPMLRLSFSESNLLPTLLLTGEALALLVLGVATRMRVFILSGAGLVIVGALRALFLPSLGIPPSLALSVLGLALLAIATGLSLARHRLQVAWKRWE